MAELNPPLISQHPFQVLFRIPKDVPPTLSQPDKWSPDFHDFLASTLIKDVDKRPTAAMVMNHCFIQQVKGPLEMEAGKWQESIWAQPNDQWA